MDRRIDLAANRCGELRHIFNSKGLPIQLKLKIYKVAVAPILTYGSEAWRIDEKTKARINGTNARYLRRITGKTAKEEASSKSRSYDLVEAVRRRRYIWLGHILRMPPSENRLVQLAVKIQYERSLPGNIFMDALPSTDFDHLRRLASDRETWRAKAPGAKTPVATGKWVGSSILDPFNS